MTHTYTHSHKILYMMIPYNLDIELFITLGNIKFQCIDFSGCLINFDC